MRYTLPHRTPCLVTNSAAAGPNLYLIHHGQTSASGMHCNGLQDQQLDDIGRAEAQVLAQELATRALDRIYCSPQLCARQTAQAIAQDRRDTEGVALQVLVRQELTEVDRTDLVEVYHRVGRFTRELRREFDLGHRVAVVGHHWSNRMLRGALLGATLEATLAMSDYQPANGSCRALWCGPHELKDPAVWCDARPDQPPGIS